MRFSITLRSCGRLCALIALVCLSFTAAHAQDSAPAADPLADCRALMVDPPPLGENPPTIRIIDPPDGAAIYGDAVQITIQAEHFDLAAGGHWHVWVGPNLFGMVFENRTVISLQPGEYRLCANLGDAQHVDLGVPDAINITVYPAGEGTPASIVDPSVRPPEPEPGANPLVIVLLGGGAAIGGVTLGTILGRRKPRPAERPAG
ncbi:MAG: hypothetical protein SF162_09870 [bacterium]|nr:hypothetical protein [bacterium]